MIAGVYFADQAPEPFDKHPCVVVLEVGTGDDCIVIPAFTAGKHRIETLIEFHVSDGVDESALSVMLNNRDSVSWHRKIDAGEKVRWATIKVDRVDRSCFAGRPAGTMKAEALLQIYRSLIAFFDCKPGENRFSAPIQKKIKSAEKKLAKKLGATPL